MKLKKYMKSVVHRKICLLVAMVSCSLIFARNSNDTLFPQNSLRLEIGGKSLLGPGVTFERAWRNKNKTKHPRAFNSVDATIGYAGYIFIIAGVGTNRNWYLGDRRKWRMSCGISVAALICPDPTPKEIREYYDSLESFGGEYINPIEPWLFGNISCRYTFKRMFAQASFTPVLYYDRAYNEGFISWPWGGLSVGIRLNSKA